MELWPLLTEDLLSGVYSVERQLRPRVGAAAVRSDSLADGHRVINDLCTHWAGGFSPLIPVDPGSGDVDDRWAQILFGSNIDGIDGRGLLRKDVEQKFSDMHANARGWLLSQLSYLDYRPKVQTSRNLPVDDPWYPSYLATFGDVPRVPNLQENRWNDLRQDAWFPDLVDIEPVDEEPSIQDLVARVGDFQRTSAVGLTRVRLPTSVIAGYNKGLPSSSRFSWGQPAASTQYGPNILVIYEYGSTEDLALLWNLRARFGHPRKLPLGMPLTPRTQGELKMFEQLHGAQHFFGMSHNLAVTSFSVAPGELQKLVAETPFEVVAPWEVLGPIYGACVGSTEMAQFSDGQAQVPAFSPTEIETLGQRYLGTSHATWLRLTALVAGHRLPASPTMRRNRWQDPGYLHGDIVGVGELDKFVTLRQPSGLEVLRAVALDRSLRAQVSTPGKSAENLIRAAGADLSMLVYPGVARLVERLTRRGHASLVKRRLDQYLAGSGVIPGDEKYETLASRLDAALGTADSDELDYMNFNSIKQTLGLTVKQTAVWIEWAVGRRLILSGIQAKCEKCKHAQWRPLSDAVPELQCHGCGLVIETPFGSQKIDYQYRASEVLLRAVNHDVLPSILAIRHICGIFPERDGTIFGAYPGVELLELGSKTVNAEFDVAIILGNGQWLVGESKVRARGLSECELHKLWTAADSVGATATFVATLDAGRDCSDLWRQTAAPNGRPHFALTAGHLYDLPVHGTAYGEDLFEWREDLVKLPENFELSEDELLRKEFGDYLLGRSDDVNKHPRAPWDTALG